MKKIIMSGVFLCGISFSLFGMDYKKVALSGCTGAIGFALSPVLISTTLPKRLIKEAPEAYAGIVLFGGTLGLAYGLVSSYSVNRSVPIVKSQTSTKFAFNDQATTSEKLRFEPFDRTIIE